MQCDSYFSVSTHIFEWTLRRNFDLTRGEAVKSGPFYTGIDRESTWHILFYPKGSSSSFEGQAAVSLELSHGLSVKASVMLTLAVGEGVMRKQDIDECVYRENDNRMIPIYFKFTNLYPARILCELKISDEDQILPYVRRPRALRSVLTDMYTLLSEQKYTDLLIVTRDKMEFRAHKLVLAARSEVFSAMLESSIKENLEGKLEISDMDGCDVEQMLQFIYSGNRKKWWSWSSCMNLLVAGDKYKIKGLGTRCSLYLQRNINVGISIEVLVFADMHEVKCLKQVALDYIKRNAIEVLKTDGWKTMVQEQPHLVDELVLHMADK